MYTYFRNMKPYNGHKMKIIYDMPQAAPRNILKYYSCDQRGAQAKTKQIT